MAFSERAAEAKAQNDTARLWAEMEKVRAEMERMRNEKQPAPAQTESAPPRPAPAPQAAYSPAPSAAARTGDKGPAGGIVLVVGSQKLEVAPANTEFEAGWDDAKSRCASLKVNGISGWRLPTKDELNAMYTELHQKRLGGFSNNWYWSSSEYYAATAWIQYFGDGFQGSYGKGNAGYVRAVRAF